MSSESPATVLYSSDGTELAVVPGSAIPANTHAILVDGSDGTDARNLLVDTSGRLNIVGAAASGSAVAGNPVLIGGSDGTDARSILTDASGRQIMVGAVASGSAVSGSPVLMGGSDGTDARTIATNASGQLVIVGTATDNTADSTAKLPVIAAVATTSAPIYSNGNMVPLSTDLSGNLRITGSITASNPSVGTDGAAVLGFDTQIGGSVTTAAPTYTTGNLNALSLTTGGLLRIDGVYPIATTTPTSDATFVAGAVTTGAPTYTTGQMDPLSLDTAGNLRVLATGSVIVNKSTTGTITSVAGSVTSVTLLASNTARVSATIFNDAPSGNLLYVALASSSSTTAYTIKLWPGSYWDLPVNYTGIITGIWTAATGNARVTELT